MLQLVLLTVLAAVVVEANLSDGQQLRGELQSLSTEGISLDTAGQVRTLSRQDLKDLVFPQLDEVKPQTVAFVQLIDESVIPCDGVELQQGKLTVRSASGTWIAPDTTVRAIRWLRPGEKTDAEWNEILGKSASEDLLVIRREMNLDFLSGVVINISGQAVQFQYAGNSIPVPFAKTAGVILARKRGDVPNPRLRLATRDGGLWMLESVELKADQLSLVSVAGVTRRLPLGEVTRVEFPQLDAVFLADLEPSSVSFVPFFGSREIEDAVEQFGRPQVDRSFDGTALRVSDARSVTGWRQFRRGLAVQSRTEMVYRLAAKYRRFRATVGLDPSAASQANVDLSLLADDQVVFQRTIDKGDEPVEVDIDVSGARRLTLVVDYGANLDIGDRVHLGDARLTK